MASYDIKAEPSDNSYEPSSGDSRNSSPVPVPKKKYRSSLAIQKAKSEIRDAMSKNKSTPKLSNVVDSLLQKNEQLLAQNDAINYKPNSRAPRGTFDSRRLEGAGLGETTFLVSQQSQARITKTQDRKEQDLVSGRLLRPRSPTRKSVIADRDKTALNTAVMESDLNDKESEKLFRVNKHDMISAVSCNAMFSSKGGKIAANIDLTYYWCNFCPYSTTSKHALMYHLQDHRFTCKYCDYQSYSRACVIKHSAKSHEEFTCMATSLKYCTVLTDYLQVNKQPKATSDDRKRKGNDDEESSSKIQKLNTDDEADDDDSQSSSNSKSDKPANDNDYEFFDMEVEEIEENNDHGTVTEEPHIPESIPVNQLPKLYPGTITNQRSQGYSNSTKSNNKSTKIQSDQDLLYQQYANPSAAMQILPDLDDDSSSGRVQTVSSPRSTRPKPAPKFAQQKAVPAKPTVSSSLYWSCGYCSFKSDSQWKIKHHSVSKHPGKPHRYVALILPPGTTHIENEEEEEEDKDIEVEVNDESDDSNSNQSSGSVNGKHSKKKNKWKVNLK
ncbi:hypothetical protein LOTGIDRAFT_239592 [Lottia gigantea]|uniref:C2H2-type domain-containing protein n=1 Tax=Lottia gigantea TaxID=225164 RepID=V4AFE7_LOTGI|nr:hypothetical protein LOTGIDRAFT_239592 [Lottia gigantea]ESO92096.1 hypothetical protein LOTGIDRAFT_239592 [Lottia gigantea]